MIDFSTLEKKCPVCEKRFIAREEWVFKRYDEGKKWPRYLCSWSCCKAWDAVHNPTGKKRHFVRRFDA